MKQLLFTLLFSFTFCTISAQKSSIDNRLHVRYNSQELKAMQVENPQELEYLTYCIENAFYVSDIPQEKVDANPERFKEINLQSSTITNFYELDLQIEPHTAQYLIIKGTSKLLMVKSKDQILLELNK